jgi:hypothetical protein
VLVLGIAAQIPSAAIGGGYIRETYPQTLFKECSDYCELVSSTNQMPRTHEVAVREAVGKRCDSRRRCTAASRRHAVGCGCRRTLLAPTLIIFCR